MALFDNPFTKPKTETQEEPRTVQEEVKRVLAQPQLTLQRQSEMTIGSLADFEPQIIMRDIPVHKKIVKSRKRKQDSVHQRSCFDRWILLSMIASLKLWRS